MKILFVVRDSHGWAGTERVLNLIANALSAHAIVEILSLSGHQGEGVGYPYVPAIRRVYHPVERNLASLITVNFTIADHVARSAYDTVILAGIGEIKYLLAAVLQRKSRFIGWEHFNAAYTHRRFNRKLAACLLDAVIVLSGRDQDDWHRYLHPRALIERIPNPVPSFPALPSPVRCRRILALGRIEEQKRFDLLLEAFAIFHREHPEWSLRIRGKGSREHALREHCASLGLGSAVEILPPTADVQTEYQEAAMYAMSSRFEGFPMTLIEAMAHGVPCVSFDCPNGPSEVIADGEDGFIVPLFDVSALAERFSRLADDEALRVDFGRRAMENIRRYEVGRIIPLWTNFLERLCVR